tara:strand:+ start:5092 stop:5502 length:411 start_codon:yes stop_codon:yes gene_type:complete
LAVLEVSVELTGKIADPNLNAQTKAAIGRGLVELATIEGQVPVMKRIEKRVKKYTGNLNRHIGAALVGPMTAQFDAGQNRYGKNLNYSYWVEGIGSRNKKSSFKGHWMFRDTTKDLMSKPRLWEKYVGQELMKVFD